MSDEFDLLDETNDTTEKVLDVKATEEVKAAKVKADKKATKAKAAAPVVDAVEEPTEAEGFELLYIGKKETKIVEMPDGCTFTFKRAFPRDHGKAVIDCEACFVKLMNNAGPGASKSENVIFVPPAQLKPFLAMRNAEARKREESLSILSQPWKQQEIMRKAQNGEEA